MMTSGVRGGAAIQLSVLIGLVATCARAGEPNPGAAQPTEDWRTTEAPMFTGAVQLTFPADFARAGEQYFSPDGQWLIFQAIPTPKAGEAPDAAYSMYVARLTFEGTGEHERLIGMEKPILLSPAGSANTCGYFHPTDPGRVIFGSTLVRPQGEAAGGYQRGTSRYKWMFPNEMDIVEMVVSRMWEESRDLKGLAEVLSQPPTPIFARDGYDAECAYSPDGRFIVHASVDPQTLDADLFVYDTTTKERTPVVTAPGYDGGPFFSPDGTMICYRSDRAGNDLLQVYIADVVFGAGGAITGVSGERALTANEHVNWAPFWHPSGRFLVYATSEVGHHNYEVFSVEAPVGAAKSKVPKELARKRLTHAPGFDGLPAFSKDGRFMVWTSQRGPKLEHEDRPSSQIWAARIHNIGAIEPR